MRFFDPSQPAHCLWRSPAAAKGFNTAVSLHSHTMHSRESLDFIPRLLTRVPGGTAWLDRIENRYRRESGRGIPFGQSFWRPPLNPRDAYGLEAGQIHDVLGMRSLVSLTDHDDLEACADLRAIGVPAPYSFEWTVPYGVTEFHLGIHNLPGEQARVLAKEMARYTGHQEPDLLRTLLADLDAIREVLIVLNHPFFNERRIDPSIHESLLYDFLHIYGGRMHALELNGLQPASDNRKVRELAAQVGLPIISGGDRHCLEPNANLNLTNASSFAEFVDEVRRERRSYVLFLPQYREPMAARYIESVWHAVRPYPGMAGRERWLDRVFFLNKHGMVVPLSSGWPKGGPVFVRCLIQSIGFLATPHVRGAMRLAFGEQGRIGA